MDLREFQKYLNKKIKGSNISVLSESDIAKVKDWIQTPSMDVNRIVSGSLFRGLPSKNTSLFVGPEGSGKSSFLCLCLVEAQKKGYKPVIIDTEGAWTHTFTERWGLDIDNALYMYEMFVEPICVSLEAIRESKEQKLAIVVDSIGALETEKLARDLSKEGRLIADQGLLQKQIKRMLKLLRNISIAQDSFVMMTGHYFGNPSKYGKPEEIGGGKFLRLVPDIIFSLKTQKLLDSDKNIIGSDVTMGTLKNRYHPPFKEAVLQIDFLKGINKFAGLIDLGVEAGLIKQKAAWFEWNGENFHGKKSLETALYGNKDYLDDLEEWVKTTKYSKASNEMQTIIDEDSKVKNDEEMNKEEV